MTSVFRSVIKMIRMWQTCNRFRYSNNDVDYNFEK